MGNKKTQKKKEIKVGNAEILGTLKEILQVIKSNFSSDGRTPSVLSTDGRFVDNGDGTISDTKNRLMWQKEGSDSELTHEEAGEYCKKLDLAGNKDWRLPTVDELETLVDRTKYDPAIVSSLFKTKSSYYWTSIIHAEDPGGAWVVGFYGGYVGSYYRGGRGCVRAVRQY